MCLSVELQRSRVENNIFNIIQRGMDTVAKRAAGETLSVRDEQRLRNHQLRMMRRAWLNDIVSLISISQNPFLVHGIKDGIRF